MGQVLHKLGIDSLSIEDRIALVQDIWDSVAAETALSLPSTAEMDELNRRLIEDDANPADTIDWNTIKTEANARWKR